MNERIQKLAEQANDHARKYVADCKHYGYYMEHNEYDLQFQEKFAELIVQECIQVCQSRVGNSDYNTGRMHCVSDIKEHFGIEK